MLQHLTIDNIAVIRHADLDFTEGFNVLTGETGAGKSILIDAINAVLGERTYKDLIRNGCDNASVTAVFSCLGSSAERLAGLDVRPDADGCVYLQRTLNAEGRNLCRINGSPVPLTTLKSVGECLIDIHGQHDNRNLLDPANHLSYLDRFAGCKEELAAYHDAYVSLRTARRELNERCNAVNEARRLADLYEFQKREIESAGLREGERDELVRKRDAARNAVKISSTLRDVCRLLSGGEEGGAKAELETAARSLSSLKALTDGIGDADSQLLGYSYEIAALSESLTALAGSVELSESELERINDRISVIDDLCRKYGGSVESVQKQYEIASAGLKQAEDADEDIRALESKIEEIEPRVIKLASALTKKRKAAAQSFCENVREVLQYLQMPSVRFEVAFSENKYTGTGCDAVEFLISANPGMPPKSLTKIASGGELSRIMLAIKSVFSDIDRIDTIIFDEIDTGISGIAADKVGHKLRDLSAKRQVICVTHLAQIAAKANAHFRIEKTVSDDSAETAVTAVTGEERLRELARIISGDRITPTVLETAKELMNS